MSAVDAAIAALLGGGPTPEEINVRWEEMQRRMHLILRERTPTKPKPKDGLRTHALAVLNPWRSASDEECKFPGDEAEMEYCLEVVDALRESWGETKEGLRATATSTVQKACLEIQAAAELSGGVVSVNGMHLFHEAEGINSDLDDATVSALLKRSGMTHALRPHVFRWLVVELMNVMVDRVHDHVVNLE